MSKGVKRLRQGNRGRSIARIEDFLSEDASHQLVTSGHRPPSTADYVDSEAGEPKGHAF